MQLAASLVREVDHFTDGGAGRDLRRLPLAIQVLSFQLVPMLVVAYD
jgi:hypothetical protein